MDRMLFFVVGVRDIALRYDSCNAGATDKQAWTQRTPRGFTKSAYGATRCSKVTPNPPRFDGLVCMKSRRVESSHQLVESGDQVLFTDRAETVARPLHDLPLDSQ
jgi:hypothetical protein